MNYYIQGYGNSEGWTGHYVPPLSGGQITVPVQALTVKTGTPITITTNGAKTSDCIYIAPGVSADITLNNVWIEGRLPINIPTSTGTPTSLHLTLADGSKNTLTALLNSYTYQFPGIRCGEGSYLTIDDGRRNVDTDGNAVLPNQGRVSRDATLVDGTEVKAGDRLTKLDSDNVGSLTVNGGYRASAIGGAALENSGNMTFNGGNLTVRAYGEGESRYGAGAGIGGGHGGGGTTMTFNGGTVDSVGSYHGAGIGGGCMYTGGMSSNVTYKLTDAIMCWTPTSTIAGDININGGYLKSRGCTHSNAFGQGCGGTNTGKTITITGGTLLPTSVGGWYDIGGQGGDVVVTGGSIRLSGAGKFQSSSNDGSAWGDVEKTTKVFMTKINLSGEDSLSDYIDSLKLTISGVEKDYGLPSKLDENNCLYLWLPNSGGNIEVRATISMLDKNGESKQMDPFFITNATHNSELKRYAEFDIPDGFFKTVEKVYDGLEIQTKDLKDVDIWTKEADSKQISDASKLSYTSQRLDEHGDEISEEEAKTLPVDVGTWQITMTSTQYSNVEPFNHSYWGHRGYYKGVKILPAKSQTSVKYERAELEAEEEQEKSDNVIRITATVCPDKDEAKTCASPTGKVQFYVNGVAVGQPVELEAAQGKNDDGFSYSTAVYDWTPSKEDVVASAEEYVITAKYIGDVHGVNYKSSEAQTKKDVDITPIEQETPIKVKDVTDAENPKDVTDKKIEKNFDDGSCTIQGEGGNSREDFIYSSEDTSIAEVDPVTGKITFKDFGEVTIKVTKPGNAAYEEKTEEVTLVIRPSAPTTEDIELEKTAENKTDPGERTQVDDVITYTIKAENKRVGSLWKAVVIKDCIPEGMELDTDSIYLVSPDGTETQLRSSCYDSTTRVLEVEVGDVRGGQKYELRFDVRITVEALNTDIGNVAEATGKTPDGDDMDSDTPTPVYPSDDDTPENGGVLFADPTPELEKTAENKTHSGKETTISDVITYTIKVENKKENSVWENVAIRDRIPEGLNLDTNSMYLVKPDGEEIHVDASAYQSAERMISVYVGDVYGGEKYIFRFDVVILEEAVGKDIGNEATAIGGNPSGNGGGIGGTGGSGGTGGTGGSGSTGGNGGTGSIWGGGNGWTGGYTGGPYTPGSPYFPEDDPFDRLEDGIGDSTDGPVYPWGDDETPDGGGVLPGNPEPELEKTVNNVTSKDGNTRQDDILVYEIELTNPKEGTLWNNVMIFDYLPDELELDVSSMILINPDGSTSQVAANVYNAATHMIKVPIAKLWGGETYILRYKAQVKIKDGGDGKKEIVNRAEATGENPDGTVSEAGKGPSSSASVKYPEVSKGVQTGDKTPVVMVVVICAVSVLVMLFVALFIFKKKYR